MQPDTTTKEGFLGPQDERHMAEMRLPYTIISEVRHYWIEHSPYAESVDRRILDRMKKVALLSRLSQFVFLLVTLSYVCFSLMVQNGKHSSYAEIIFLVILASISLVSVPLLIFKETIDTYIFRLCSSADPAVMSRPVICWVFSPLAREDKYLMWIFLLVSLCTLFVANGTPDMKIHIFAVTILVISQLDIYSRRRLRKAVLQMLCKTQ